MTALKVTEIRIPMGNESERRDSTIASPLLTGQAVVSTTLVQRISRYEILERIAAALEHTNVTRVHDYRRTDNAE